jgi:choline dehydrogenase-like flavoprotein
MNVPGAYTQAEQRLAAFLKLAAILFVVPGIFAVVFPYTLSDEHRLNTSPIFIANTAAGLWVLALLAWFAAGDVRRFRPMVYVLIGTMFIGGLGLGVVYALNAAVSQSVPLLVGLLLYAIGTIVLAVLVSRAKLLKAPWLPWLPNKPITSWECIAQAALVLFGVGALVTALVSLLTSLNATLLPDSSINPVLLVTSTFLNIALGIAALLTSTNVRRFTHQTQMMTLVIIGHVVSLVTIILLVVLGLDQFKSIGISIGSTTVTSGQIMFGVAVLEVIIIALLLFLLSRINRVLLDHIEFLSPTQFRAMEAIAETLIAGGGEEVVPPHEIVLRTDSYLRSFRSERLGLAKLALLGLELAPLFWLQPPITYLNPSVRTQFVDQHFKKDIVTPTFFYRFFDRFLYAVNKLILRVQGRSPEEANAALSFTGLLEAVMRFNMQLAYLGYYSNPEVWPKHDNGGLGYTPFSQRPKTFDPKPIRHHPPLDVMTPLVLEQNDIDVIDDADVVIIGSGAAGATLAEQLLKQGRRVLILEKGLYVSPDDFNEDEVDMISRLYSDGALQISQALRFTILQGSCVGGTTVVNNAVCFDTPQQVLDCWNSRSSSGKVIDDEQFYAAQRQVRRRMRIGPITSGTRQPLDQVLNHGDSLVTAAVHKYFENRADQYKYEVVEANIVDCLGCGYCNIGCKYGRKLSMLDEVLPAAQQKYGVENLRIISEAQVTRLVESDGTITQVVARIQGNRQLLINKPKTVIVSGGTIHSSWLLMQSGIGKGKLPVGQGLSFNMGSPLHALFDHDLNAYDGLQISHYLALQDHPGFVYETWYNPPVAQALAMPGWLDTHYQNMQNYNRIAGVGVLVGTESNARIVPALITGGPDVVFQPTQSDMKKLIDALVILGDIFFSGGALEVYASTRTYHPYVNRSAVLSAQSEVDRLRELVRHDYDILLGTGHPQGGNAIGMSPTNSVVGPDFKVFGFSNLYVCDASVFPTSTTVNPQLTVMTMAHYAAQIIQ